MFRFFHNDDPFKPPHQSLKFPSLNSVIILFKFLLKHSSWSIFLFLVTIFIIFLENCALHILLSLWLFQAVIANKIKSFLKREDNCVWGQDGTLNNHERSLFIEFTQLYTHWLSCLSCTELKTRPFWEIEQIKMKLILIYNVTTIYSKTE